MIFRLNCQVNVNFELVNITIKVLYTKHGFYLLTMVNLNLISECYQINQYLRTFVFQNYLFYKNGEKRHFIILLNSLFLLDGLQVYSEEQHLPSRQSIGLTL